MEQIIQLKTMRDEALERLQVNPDFKLVNSLDALITDLEAVLTPVEAASPAPIEDDEAQDSIETPDETIIIASDDPSDDEEADIAMSDDAGEQADSLAEMSAEAEDEIGEISAEVAATEPQEISSAIEALEAELSQAGNGIDENAAPSTPSLN